MNYSIQKISLIFVLLISNGTVFGEEAINLGAVSLDESTRYSFYSEDIRQNYFIDVVVPKSYVSGNRNYPVLYVTDGIPLFQLVASNKQLLELGGVQESILVGISYDGTFMDQLFLRERDLTPTVDEDWNQQVHEAGLLPEEVSSGGADLFLEFLLEDVKPLINKNYRTNEENETLLGHSDGGLFALYALLKRPESFNSYVASSPGLGWDGSVFYSIEDDLNSERDDLKGNLYLSAGSLETELVPATRRLYQTLRDRGFESLNLEFEEFENESHTSVVSPALNRGIRYVFGLQ